MKKQNVNRAALCATTALVTAGIMLAAPVQAADHGRFVPAGDAATIEVADDETVEGDRIGVYSQAPALTLNNAGTIRGNGSYDGFERAPEGGVIIQGGPATITNVGTISGAGLGISTIHSFNPATGLLEGLAIGSEVVNSGAIIGETNDGVRLIGGGSVTNSGTISGTGSGFADGISMFAFDDQDVSGLSSIGSITNEAGGTISGSRFGAILSNGGTIDNAGTMTGGVSAIWIQNGVPGDSGKVGTLTNSGTVSGGGGVGFGGNLDSAELANSGSITGTLSYGVTNASAGRLAIDNGEDGVIEGALIGVHDQEGGIDLVNAGVIRGNGSYDGFERAPEGGVTIQGAPSTITNSGTIAGAGHGISTAYYYNPETQGIEGRATGTVVVNSGAISGETNDGVRLIGGGSVTNSGTITAEAGAFSDGISMYAYADQANEDYGAAVTNSETGVIEGTRFGIILSGGGDVANDGAITGISGGVFIQGTALNTDPNEDRSGLTATVVNTGTIRGTGDFGGSNGDGYGVGFGSDMSSATLDNAGAISSDFGVGVLQGSRADLTVTNSESGTITGATSGIYSNATGTLAVVNAGIIRGNGTYDGFAAPPDAGITIGTAGSSVTNSGTISGAGAGITTTSLFDEETGQLVGLAIGTDVVNSGVIAGESNDGVRLIGGGSVTNGGTISGTGGSLADGISMFAYADQASEDYSAFVGNAATGSIEGDRFGIILSGGGDVENAGSIAGGDGGLFIQGTALNSGERSGLTASVVNSGSITGSRADGLNGYGVGFGSDLATATLDNSGTVGSVAGAGVFHGTFGDVTITNAAGGAIEGGTHGVYAGGNGSLTLANAGTIRGNGTYEGPDAPADAGVMIQSADAVVANSGTISGAGYGIVTQLYFNDDTGQLEARATGTAIANSGTIRGEANDAIRLFGGGSVVNSGLIEGVAGEGTDGITIQAFAGQDTSDSTMLGSVVNEAGGTISGARYGVLAVSGASVTNAGSIAGGVTGVVIGRQSSAGKTGELVNSGSIEGGVLIDVDSATATNSGSITSDTGVAFSSLGAITLTNSGVLAGGAGIAATLSGFDDELILQTGSAITGSVDGGDGFDTVTLSGAETVLTSAQTIGALDNFEALAVEAGYWTTSGAVGAFEGVAIGAGATLKVGEVASDAGPASAILTNRVVTDGTLIFDFDSDAVLEEADDLVITGTGNVRLEGEATIIVDRADAAQHTGRTEVANGTLVLTGEGRLASTVVTEGDGTFQLGDGGTTGTFEGDLVNDGRFVFNRSDDYDFLGAFTGSGTLDKLGGGILTFTGDYGFSGVTNILAGSVRIGGMIDPETVFDLGGGTLDVSGNDQTIGGLAGGGDSAVIIGSNVLTVDQEDDSEFAGTIAGTGGFTKDGDGKLNLTGTSTYTGPTNVNGGTLAVNGSIASSPVTVGDGGTLGGNGTVGSTTVGGGGIIAPGNSIGRLTVAGDLAFTAGSVYEVEVNAAGEADRIDATGAVTIASTARVSVLAEEGNYNPRTDYIILTGAGGITGTFGSVTSDLAFLDPLLRYGSNSVTLSLYRNDIDFADVAIGTNQAGVAAAIQARGIDDPLFEALLVQNAAGAQAAYGDLSGEILADALSGLTDDSRHLRNALLNLDAPDEAGAFVWGSAFGGWGDFDAAAGGLDMDTDHKGLVVGFGYGGNGFAAALSAGIGNSDFGLDGRNDRAKADSKYLAAHVTYGSGEGFRGAAGLAYGWHDVDTTRSVVFAPLAQTLNADRDARTLQLFGEAGYDLALGTAAVAPFARLAHVRTKSDAFVETGGNAALAVAEAKQETTFLSLGARARLNAGEAGFQPYASAAWNRAFGDRAAAAPAAFASGGGVPFTITGLSIPRNSAEVEAGFDYRAGAFSLGAAYSGTLAAGRSTHGVRVSARIAF